VWAGEHGETYFYQSELPYDVDQEAFGDRGYTGYLVEKGVRHHQALGLGVYSFFRDHPCNVTAALKAPREATRDGGVRFVNAFTKHLNGHPGISNIFHAFE